MPKGKPCKGIVKRVRITAGGRIKLTRGGGRHLRSAKSGELLRSYRKPIYASPPDARRISRLLLISPIPKASRRAAARPASGESD
jgi:ribosomal protein L35